MSLSKWLLSLAVFVALALPALAQRPQPGGNNFGDLFARKEVQDDLKIDADTAKKAGEVVTKQREKLTEARKDLTQREIEGEKGAKLAADNREETYKALSDVLKPEQVKRYKQIDFQWRLTMGNIGGGRPMGMGGAGGGNRPAWFASEEVAKLLKLSKDQQEDVKKLSDDYSKARQGIQQNDADARTKLRTEYSEKFQKVLTDEQKKTWDEAYGKPIQFSFGQRPTRQTQQ